MVVLTHIFIQGFGWEPTIFVEEDFYELNLLAKADGFNIYQGKIEDSSFIRLFKGFKATKEQSDLAIENLSLDKGKVVCALDMYIDHAGEF